MAKRSGERLLRARRRAAPRAPGRRRPKSCPRCEADAPRRARGRARRRPRPMQAPRDAAHVAPCRACDGAHRRAARHRAPRRAKARALRVRRRRKRVEAFELEERILRAFRALSRATIARARVRAVSRGIPALLPRPALNRRLRSLASSSPCRRSSDRSSRPCAPCTQRPSDEEARGRSRASSASTTRGGDLRRREHAVDVGAEHRAAP